MTEIRYLHGNGMELVVCRQSAISYPPHSHVSVLTLGLVLDGAAELVTDEGARLCQAGETYAVPPYAPHHLEARPRCTLLSLCVSKGLASGGGFEDAEPDIAAFLRAGLGQPAVEVKMLHALRGQRIPVQKETPLSALKTRLETRPERRCSLDDMAKLALMSKYHLIRAFKRETGLTPHQFQIQNRVRKAQRLLRGSAAIAEAALAAGFCDQSHLIRHFRRLVGMTPADYRLACRAETPIFLG